MLFYNKERVFFYPFPYYRSMNMDKTLFPETLKLLFTLHFFHLAIAFMSIKTPSYEKCCKGPLEEMRTQVLFIQYPERVIIQDIFL